MIQKTNPRLGGSASANRSFLGSSTNITEQHWGSWSGTKHYSLEVLQHPIRARMCGFGDKDRRPLAPAAVAKMVVQREDNSIVDVDEIDVAFFVVTVDLWSADGKNEMNLVMHPSSTDRYVPAHVSKPRRRVNTSNAPLQKLDSSSSQSQSLVSSRPSLTNSSSFGPNFIPHPATIPDPKALNTSYPSHSEPSGSWTPASHIVEPRPGLPPIQSFGRSANPSGASPTLSSPWHLDSQARDTSNVVSYRNWDNESSTHPDYSSLRTSSSAVHPIPAVPAWSPPPTEGEVNQSRFATGSYRPSQSGVDNSPVYATAPYGPYSDPHSRPPLPPPSSQSYPSPPSPVMHTSVLRHAYTRTLVGPLSANACRLLDEHRKPGVFFLFQDLSIRTEGTFRLRMRLMNVGSLPTPDAGSLSVMTSFSPILAQTFTEPFIVYSAKRFPGVPDTTALSIAFGNQGQKLPLRNRHGSRQQGRRRRRELSDGSEDDSDAT